MSDQETHGTVQRAEPVQAGHHAEFDPYQATDHQARPPVVAFDPYFASPSSRRDFDEIMWERAG